MSALVEQNWPVLVPTALGMLALYLLLPRAQRVPPLYGAAVAALALVAGGWWLIDSDWILVETILFYTFACLAILFGGMMITQRNPVHAALSFAMVVLSTCGLFLLQAAPFLMAATIIVYAGAIVVTFLFVIMLAQQAGLSSADQRSREPFLATVAGFVLLASLLCVLHQTYGDPGDRLATNAEPVSGKLDRFIDRVQRASTADTVKDWQEILGSDDTFFIDFRHTIEPTRPFTKSDANRRALSDAIQSAQVTWSSILPSPDGPADDNLGGRNQRIESFKKELAEVCQWAARVRYSHGSLRPDKSLPLSSFSGAAANLPMEISKEGKPVERLKAANVAGLGKALFTDYLLAVELAGTLLLIATIGAIAIAGRRGKELR